MGLLGVGGIAFAVSRVVGADIKAEQVNNATRSAELLAASALGPHLTGDAAQLSTSQIRALDQAALAARRTAGLTAIAVWGTSSRVVYATDHRLIGKRIPPPAPVRTAFSGQTSTSLRNGANSPVGNPAGQQINIAVPTYQRGRADPAAAVDMTLAYAPIAREISDRTRRINLILIGAALLFYAALLPRLLRASRALRSQNDPRRQALMRELSTAIDRDQLLLHYQPTIDLTDGTVIAVEALLRWQHPKRGLLAPSEFLPTVNDSTLTGRLTLHVTEMALRDCAAWRERGIDAAVNVNLSARNALDEKLPARIGKVLATSGIPANALGLELTESAIAADPERAGEMLRSLARMGVRIAIDDFGTGYSSLAGLRDLPVSELKVDRSFVSGLIARPRDAAIVRSIIQLAHELEVQVIAEGVEDEDTVQELAALGCDMAQGYYFSAPQPLGALIEWFEAPLIAGRGAAQEPTLAMT